MAGANRIRKADYSSSVPPAPRLRAQYCHLLPQRDSADARQSPDRRIDQPQPRGVEKLLAPGAIGVSPAHSEIRVQCCASERIGHDRVNAVALPGEAPKSGCRSHRSWSQKVNAAHCGICYIFDACLARVWLFGYVTGPVTSEYWLHVL